MTAAETHNSLARQFVGDVLRETAIEAEAMVVAETVLLALMIRFRPNVREAGEFLDLMTERVLERLAKPDAAPDCAAHQGD